MNAALKMFCVALALVLAAPAFGKSASRTRLLTSPNPAKAGAKVLLQAEVDGRGNGPTGTVSFTDGAVALGSATLSRIGAGQATLAAGEGFTCAVSAAGGVRCWGSNGFGELADRSTKDRLTPVNVWGLSNGVVAIAAGWVHTCALTVAGAVECWGSNIDYLPGDGAPPHRLTPVAVPGLASGVVAIAAGGSHNCALTAAGAVKCWGRNDLGQLGDGTTSTPATPVAVSGLSSGVVAISAGQSHSCALTGAGAVKCWGSNLYGQLGDGTKTNRWTPVVVSGLSSGVVAIAAGGRHTCALTTAGAVKCWGSGADGQLGDGSFESRATPGPVSGLSSGVVAITAGFLHNCALSADGAAKCWGRAGFGQIGDGFWTANRPTPRAVAGLSSGVGAISAGVFHTCAVTNGGVKCWGNNWRGQLGDGTTTNRNAPISVLRLTPVVRARARLSTRSLGLGAHVLQASFPGDAAHTPSSGSNAQTIVP
jgi:alpha-tubulin suppressor-like RCC1 family protein